MTTIFVNKIKNNQGGNPVQINQLRGIDTAGSISVQGEGTATTNLQQGLLKAWHRAEGDISTVAYNDSFNFASITDNGTGNYTSTLSNAMNNANYSISVESDMGGGNGGFNAFNKSNSSASAVRTYSFTDAGSFRDVDPILLMVAGDLA